MENLTCLTSSTDLEWLVSSCPATEALIRSRIKLFMLDNQLTLRHKALDFVTTHQHISEIQSSFYRTDFWFITVNPKPGVTFLQLEESILSMLKNYSNYIYVFEITDNPKKAPHCHLIFYSKMHDRNTKYNIQMKFIRKGIVSNKKAIDIKWLKTPKDVKDTINYIRKTQSHKSKDKSDKLTKLWRIQNNIQPYYCKGDSLFISLPDVKERPLVDLSAVSAAPAGDRASEASTHSTEIETLIPLNY